MSVINRGNFTKVDPNELPDAIEFRNCNFWRPSPDMTGANPVGHRLWPNDNTPRKFYMCNLVNCEVPPGSEIVMCNTAIADYTQIDRTETITVDGVVVASEDFEKHVIYGRFNPDTGQYDYLGTPEEVVPQ